MQDIQKTIIDQYANSPAICAIIEARDQSVDPSNLINQWYNNVWNIQTAIGYGLDVWGRIVGVDRTISLENAVYLGWAEAEDIDQDSFNNGIWYNGENSTSNVIATDNFYRQMIMAKAAANIWDGSITGLNKIMVSLFSQYGPAWIEDGEDMTMTYCFNFAPDLFITSVIQNSGILPRPSGVLTKYRIV